MKGDFKNEIEMVLSMYRRKGLTYKKLEIIKKKQKKSMFFVKRTIQKFQLTIIAINLN